MDVYVRPGDSLWYYSQLFKIPLQLIIDSNRNINPQILSVGQRIQIPGFVTANYKIQTRRLFMVDCSKTKSSIRCTSSC